MTRQAAPQAAKQTSTTHPLSSGLLQRKCESCGQHGVSGGKCGTCQKQESFSQNENQQETQIQRKTDSNSAQSSFNHEFSRVPISTTIPRIQHKLRVSQANDKYEQEADRIADHVMRMPDPNVQRQIGTQEEEKETLQAKPIASQITSLIQRQVELQEDEEDLQMKEIPGHTPSVRPQIQGKINALRSSGQPLPKSVRSFYEPRFGVNLSSTRIHTNESSAAINRSLSSRAFTLGSDIFFNRNEFQLNSDEGHRLLAHELTHVVQQHHMAQKRIQKKSINNPKFPCRETSLLAGGLKFFGTSAHLAIQQHFVSNIDPLAATEYEIPGSSALSRTGRADIVDSDGGIYEIKPVGRVKEGFDEAVNYLSYAEMNCDPEVNWHLGYFYYQPSVPMIVDGYEITSWLAKPGVIAYTKKPRRRRQRQSRERADQPRVRDTNQGKREVRRRVARITEYPYDESFQIFFPKDGRIPAIEGLPEASNGEILFVVSESFLRQYIDLYQKAHGSIGGPSPINITGSQFSVNLLYQRLLLMGIGGVALAILFLQGGLSAGMLSSAILGQTYASAAVIASGEAAANIGLYAGVASGGAAAAAAIIATLGLYVGEAKANTIDRMKQATENPNIFSMVLADEVREETRTELGDSFVLGDGFTYVIIAKGVY